MHLSRRQKVTIISLISYWSAIFILTHIPISRIGLKISVSDKILHCIAYFILAFLLWFAISPDKKVHWRKSTVWWILVVIVWYGALDEWLQGYVGRNTDIMDFFADISGALTGLILLSIFPFWPASLAVTASVIFILTNLSQANLADLLPVTNAVFHFCAYAFFSLLWLQYIHRSLPVRPPQGRWLIGAIALPAALLVSVEFFASLTGDEFNIARTAISSGGVVIVVMGAYLVGLFRRRPFF